MAYEELKATKKSSKSDSAKNAISAALGSISKPKSTNSRKPRSTSSTKSTGTKSTKSTSKSGTSKTTSAKKSPTKTSTTKKRTTKNDSLASIAAPIIISGLSSSEKSKNTSKNSSNQSSTKKNSKSALALILVVMFLAIGIIAGYFTMKFMFANDVYEMNVYANGEADITIGENESATEYQELGVKCIAFGKDFSDSCTVKYYYRNSLTESEIEVEKVGENGEGIYYAVYTSSSIKYKTVTLIRNIIVLRGEDDA